MVVWTIGTGIWGALKKFSRSEEKSSQVMVGDGVLFVSYVVLRVGGNTRVVLISFVCSRVCMTELCECPEGSGLYVHK